MKLDSHELLFHPHGSSEPIKISSGGNNIHIGRNEPHLKLTEAGTEFIGAVSFDAATVTGIQQGGATLPVAAADVDVNGTSLDTVLTQQDASVTTIQNSLTTVQNSLATLDSDDVILPNSTDTVTTKLGTIDTNLTNVTQDVNTLQSDVTTLQGTTVKITGNADIDGVKHFRDNTFRFAKNYRFVHDPTTDEGVFEHFDGSSNIGLFTVKPTDATGATLQMNSQLKLQTGDGLQLDTAGNTSVKEDTGAIVLEGTSAGFQLQVNQSTKFTVEENNGAYEAILEGSTLAKVSDITDAPIRQLFKESVIEGGLGDGTTLDTEFRNAISISAFKYQITNPDPIAWAVTTTPNSFTCDCASTFNDHINLGSGVDIRDVNGASVLGGPTVTVYSIGTGTNDIIIEDNAPGSGVKTIVAGNFKAVAVDYGGGRIQVTMQGDINFNNPSTYTNSSGSVVSNPHYNYLLRLPTPVRPTESHEFVISQSDPSSVKSLGALQLGTNGRLIRVDSSFVAADGSSSNVAPDRYRRAEGMVYWILP